MDDELFVDLLEGCSKSPINKVEIRFRNHIQLRIVSETIWLQASVHFLQRKSRSRSGKVGHEKPSSILTKDTSIIFKDEGEKC